MKGAESQVSNRKSASCHPLPQQSHCNSKRVGGRFRARHELSGGSFYTPLFGAAADLIATYNRPAEGATIFESNTAHANTA